MSLPLSFARRIDLLPVSPVSIAIVGWQLSDATGIEFPILLFSALDASQNSKNIGSAAELGGFLSEDIVMSASGNSTLHHDVTPHFVR